MSEASKESPNPPAPPEKAGTLIPVSRRPVGALRADIPLWQSLGLTALCIGLLFGLWWLATYGEHSEDRWISAVKLPSPAETFSTFYPKLYVDRALVQNTLASLRRVVVGFSAATLVGVPLGVLCGCFPRIAAFMAPVNLFGRNIPMAALIPLTFMLFGLEEFQKSMFIFLAAVAFIITDAAQAIRNVDARYIDTAYTLGARRWQVVLKVLVPLAMPNIFNSLRLLFGLAFGYIMLVEVVQTEGNAGGLGAIINISSRKGPREHIYLVLMLIPILALAIDRALFWIQAQLFPYRYGGDGMLNSLFKMGVYSLAGVGEQFWQSPADVACRNLLAGYPAPSGPEPEAPPENDSRQQPPGDDEPPAE
ncbi:ABC transporter permease [Lignipirellula cremea]|uniref:Bicarbonate transport system permease protein CmpB n=1 Tax=Lignipirellula cremea TaxID=2528010 RepID=A0A518E012_9BACT|nr:ABC transporter permease [Lignipirellula cremea]QDU97429.1 Bicarbonate transport system permease protein CmpB [Lignipirellula cremea]